eukprot:1712170-Prymnesium_polylepis.1
MGPSYKRVADGSFDLFVAASREAAIITRRVPRAPSRAQWYIGAAGQSRAKLAVDRMLTAPSRRYDETRNIEPLS